MLLVISCGASFQENGVKKISFHQNNKQSNNEVSNNPSTYLHDKKSINTFSIPDKISRYFNKTGSLLNLCKLGIYGGVFISAIATSGGQILGPCETSLTASDFDGSISRCVKINNKKA